ncbi:hypothetical protein JW998_02705, partial [candidate division KSB1 bacterium]|nr:hypothetical protein [candidate division KSB1 bacterium]
FIALAMGLLTTGLMFYADIDLTPLGETGEYVLELFVRSLNSCCWLVTILGFGSRYLGFNNKLLHYAREAAMPFYILHQTIIITIGYFIADWDAGVLLKLILLSVLSFAIIMVLYELLIKRIHFLGFLFGMKRATSPH